MAGKGQSAGHGPGAFKVGLRRGGVTGWEPGSLSRPGGLSVAGGVSSWQQWSGFQ